MSGPILYDFGGLVTAPGLLARNPASCIEVTNFRFPHAGVMRKRPGFAVGAQTVGANETFTALMSSPLTGGDFYALGGGATNPSVRVLYTGGPSTAWSVIPDIATSVADFGSREPRLAVMGGNSYIASFATKRLESAGYRGAGMPKGLPPLTYSMDAAVYSVLQGAGGYLTDGANAAYRVTYHLKVNGVELGGAPTSRLVVRNITGTSGYAAATTAQVQLRIQVPYEVSSSTALATTSFFWRLWRSQVATGADTAADEMYQVAEGFFSSTDITNGYAVYTDITPDVFLTGQPRLHTNSSNFPPLEAGLLNGQTYADDPPPTGCRDIAVFAECMWYAAPYVRAAQTLRLISASFTAGNTVTINGQVCTAVAGAPVNPGDFTFITTLATLSLNIEATARNIVDAYNRTSARATVTAHYISQGTQSPGLIYLEEYGRLSTFSVSSASAGALFSPNITTARAANAASSGNTLYFSKPGRADAVPTINALTCGPSSGTIYRIVPFRERLLVFSSAGLYQVDGTDYSNFTVSLVDETARIFQGQAIAVQEDAVYAWCYSGIVEITDGATRVISDAIEPLIRTIFAQTYSLSSGTIFGDAFAVADKTNHLVYFFYTLGGSGQPNCAQWLEFDTRSRKWGTGATTDGTGRACGAIQQSTGLLVLAEADSNPFSPTGVARVFIQRNALNATTDYADDTPAGTAQPVVSTAVFQFQLPDPDARQHWQQLLIQFEDGERSFYVRPSGVALSWTTDAGGLVGGATHTVSSPLLRVETPALARRATRQQVKLVHSLAESCGLIAVNQSMRGRGSRFPK